MTARINIRLTIALGAFFIAGAVQAFEIDTNKYFAYFKMPDRYRSGVSTQSPYILLSHDKCEAKGVGKGIIAYKGISYLPYSRRQQYQCWTKFKENIITVCPIDSVETGNIGNACIEISQTKFFDTKSLPKKAEF